MMTSIGGGCKKNAAVSRNWLGAIFIISDAFCFWIKKMKKTICVVLLMGIAGNLYAVCPKTLTGRYSMSGAYVQSDVVGTNPVDSHLALALNNAQSSAQVWSFTATKATLLKGWKVSTTDPGLIDQSEYAVSGFVEARHFGCFDALSRISADELI